jgi:type IV secretory pathway VirB2 component (pilin)
MKYGPVSKAVAVIAVAVCTTFIVTGWLWLSLWLMATHGPLGVGALLSPLVAIPLCCFVLEWMDNQ